jgi:hypothetical protein
LESCDVFIKGFYYFFGRVLRDLWGFRIGFWNYEGGERWGGVECNEMGWDGDEWGDGGEGIEER